MVQPEYREVTVTMASGKEYNGFVTKEQRLELLNAVAATEGVFVMTLWNKPPPAEDAKMRTIYLRKSAIESVE